MISRKLADLIQRLHRLTVNKKINWLPTESEDKYQFDQADFSIRVSSVDYSGALIGNFDEKYVIEIFNSDGKLIESYTTKSLTALGSAVLTVNLSGITSPSQAVSESELLEIDSMLGSIFNSARHQAESVDRVLDEIMYKLDSIE